MTPTTTHTQPTTNTERPPDGGPAFPSVELDVNGDFETHHIGMTLRDYFAAKALQGCLAYSFHTDMSGNWQTNSTPESLAKFCYAASDAMLVIKNGGAA